MCQPWFEDSTPFFNEEYNDPFFDDDEDIQGLLPFQFQFDDEQRNCSLNEQNSSLIQENCTQRNFILPNEYLLENNEDFALEEKKKVELTQEGKKFKEILSLHFIGNKNKPVRKEVLQKMYHPLFVEKLKPLVKLRNANRDEQRDVRLYYNEFAKYQNEILQASIELENEKRINYPLDRGVYLKYAKENKKSKKTI